VPLADNNPAGTTDPACSGTCAPLASAEWLAVRKSSGLGAGNTTLIVLEGAHGTNTGYIKKSEREAAELPATMQRAVVKGQVLHLARPAVVLDPTYYLIALADGSDDSTHGDDNSADGSDDSPHGADNSADGVGGNCMSALMVEPTGFLVLEGGARSHV
jgi:hypothetical protein